MKTMLEILRRQFAHEAWAAARFDAALGSLSDAEFVRPLGPGLTSLASRLAHVADADLLWLTRIEEGVSPSRLPDDARFDGVAAYRRHAASVRDRKEALLAQLTERDLERPLSYQNTRGEPFEQPLHEALQHLVMHSAYHRGQAAVALRALGKTPPATDLIVFLRTTP